MLNAAYKAPVLPAPVSPVKDILTPEVPPKVAVPVTAGFVIVGLVLLVIHEKFMLVEVRSSFSPGEELEILPFKGEPITFKADNTLSKQNIQRLKSEYKIKRIRGTISKSRLVLSYE